ncbi:UDP-N-acetylmuramate--L-alanine ligase [Yimella lutea]|uniref:UDP-N-acetylmuramate--L-alanine ligase n=1 Tax=Yimella lutea TaxID=587872 RepID=A0A542EFS4_9MICO|nr:UDP-N-acetylmuramate--L-alanine ligase [Yimella lutea]TQJ14183.1 UDP-N-acetylmuramate--L-alanine ligase [Yimella lutea]
MSNGVNERFDFNAPLPALDEVHRVHFIAVGGSGMSGVARLMRARGLEVSGSDNAEVPVLDNLAAEGIGITIGYEAATAAALPDGTLVVVSSAIKEDNPELSEVRRRGLPVLHRSQGLALVLETRSALAVAGANGKTSTSGIATAALRDLGRDPSFAIGAEVLGVGANSGVGAGQEFVVEADESDGSFVVYHPRVAIITSVKDDHLDFYGTTERLVEAYRAFALTTDPDGLIVCCADDPGSADLARWARDHGRTVLTYGTQEGADVRIEKLAEQGWSAGCLLWDIAGNAHNLQLNVPGFHNLENAAGVVAALVYGFGVDSVDAVASVAAFRGTSRRCELKGEIGGIRVVDDYAHNQGKLAAAVRTGRHLRGDGRLIVVFQPHLYSRTRDQAIGMAEALDGADVVLLMNIYGAREQPVEGVTSDLIAQAMRRPCTRTHSAQETVDLVVTTARPGDLVLTVGAGDVTALGPQILERLAESTSSRT